MSEKKEQETLEEAKPKLEQVSAEVNQNHHLAYLGQQINQINGQMAKLNENIRVFGFLHTDLHIMNGYLYWLALIAKVSLFFVVLSVISWILLFLELS